MALTELDQQLLDRCLQRKPRAWEDFVDRFLGLVLCVIHHCAEAWPVRLSVQDREDLCADVMLGLLKDDFAVLRRFRRQSSLATYLTVVVRRMAVRQLHRRHSASTLDAVLADREEVGLACLSQSPDRDVENREELARLFGQLSEKETSAVQMYYFDGRDYAVIGRSLGIPENSVGPVLSRARNKMRRAAQRQQAGWSRSDSRSDASRQDFDGRPSSPRSSATDFRD